MTTETNPRNGHPANCMCPPCLADDMDRHAVETFGKTFGDADPFVAGVRPTRNRKTDGYMGISASRSRPTKMISEKQIDFVRSLLRDRDSSTFADTPTSDEVPNLTSRQASEWIDKLLRCPSKGVRPATTKQLYVIKRDGETLAHSDKAKDVVKRALEGGGSVGAEEASDTIAEMYDRGNPRARAALAASRTVTPGLYKVGDDVYRVVKAQGGTHCYAKKLDPQTKVFDYAAGALALIKPEDLMGPEAAEVLSIELGYCAVCGRSLTNSTSLKRGIGPVCWGRQGG